MSENPGGSVSNSDSSPGNLPSIPVLARLVEGDAALPFPDAVLYPPKPNRSLGWLLLAFLGSCAAGGVAIGAFLWLINLPPTVDCENMSATASDRARLYCAQVAAETGEIEDILAGLELLGEWPTAHPLHHEVQPLVDQWSAAALAAAQEALRQNHLDVAKSYVNRIPQFSAVYEQAQAALDTWESEWQKGEAIHAKAQAALQQKDWQTASDQLLALAALSNDHWRQAQVRTLSEQIRQEKQGQRLLAQAKTMAAPGGVDRLSSAIRAASQITPDSYAWQEAQPYLDRWSDLLLGVALDQWYADDLQTAVRITERVALNPNRAQAAQELRWLSQSRQLAQASLGDWRTSPEQMMGLYRAMLLVNHISTESPYYPQAKSSLDTWRLHLKDLGQIQLAQTLGQFGNRNLLTMAMHQAEAISPENPRRQQAQTLVAHWRKEIERIEDRPVLVKAQQLADSGTLSGLNAAMQTAGEIALGRALRPEAQNLIYLWNNQIQILEDQPILTRAQALANSGNLSQAIATASEIRSGRALHEEAQAAIATWQARIRALELAKQKARQEATQASKAPPTNEAPSTENSADTSALPAQPAQAPEQPALTPSPARVPNAAAPQPRRSTPLPQQLETVSPEVLPPPEPVRPSPAAPVNPVSAPQPIIQNEPPVSGDAPDTVPVPIPAAAPAPLIPAAPSPLIAPPPIETQPPQTDLQGSFSAGPRVTVAFSHGHGARPAASAKPASRPVSAAVSRPEEMPPHAVGALYAGL